MNLESVIERVKNLLALAKSTSVNESANAAAAANKLMDKYRIEMADLETSTEVTEAIEEDTGFIYESGKITRWKSDLVDVLVKHYGLACWNNATYQTGRMVTRLRLVGRRSDILIAKTMFNWLVLECQRLSNVYAKGQGRVFVASYCQGFVSGVAGQLNASRVEVEKEATGTAIVKINARSDEAAQFMNTIHKLKDFKSISYSRTNSNAFYMGQKAGANLHLGKSMGQGKVKLLNG